jgi:hypothetical protein
VLTLPLGFSRDVGVGFWIDSNVASPDGLIVLVDGNQIYKFQGEYSTSYWTVDAPAGAGEVEWRVQRTVSGGAAPVASITDIAVFPTDCP